MNNDLIIAIKSLVMVPELIPNLINSIGNLKMSNRLYVPQIAQNLLNRGGNFIPQAEQVTYSNLRRVVLALANPATPTQTRFRFYRNNPIPGAEWQNIEFR